MLDRLLRAKTLRHCIFERGWELCQAPVRGVQDATASGWRRRQRAKGKRIDAAELRRYLSRPTVK
jgi:hypothetical protein